MPEPNVEDFIQRFLKIKRYTTKTLSIGNLKLIIVAIKAATMNVPKQLQHL